MERFVINFNMTGTEEKLFVEQMDADNHRFSVERNNEERKLYDSDPIILEKTGSGGWALATENSWPLDDSQISEIGALIERHRLGSQGFETGVNAK